MITDGALACSCSQVVSVCIAGVTDRSLMMSLRVLPFSLCVTELPDTHSQC
jgi:hypothetical protein